MVQRSTVAGPGGCRREPLGEEPQQREGEPRAESREPRGGGEGGWARLGAAGRPFVPRPQASAHWPAVCLHLIFSSKDESAPQRCDSRCYSDSRCQLPRKKPYVVQLVRPNFPEQQTAVQRVRSSWCFILVPGSCTAWPAAYVGMLPKRGKTARCGAMGGSDHGALERARDRVRLCASTALARMLCSMPALRDSPRGVNAPSLEGSSY